MLIVRPTSSFLSEGAIIPTEEELNVIIHALIEECDRVIKGRGTYYGRMTRKELSGLITNIEEYRKARGA